MRVLGVVLTGFLFACGSDHSLAPQLVRPACTDPAPLSGEFDPRAPGYIVLYRDGVDAQQETAILAARFQFVPRHVYTHALQGFSAEFSPEVVAAVRCEPTVRAVSHDGVVSIQG
jgi:hypothetical protein